MHSQEDSYKLGLTSIEGSCDSYKIQSLVEQKLMEYGIKFSHILASTEDGASIMKKYGRLNGIENQFCINHAIHLAVLDTFYKKVSVVNKPVDKISDSDNSDSDEETENQFNSYSGDHNLDIDLVCNNEIEYNLKDANINDVLQNSRKIIRFFRRSLIRNNLLQRYVEEINGKKFSIILDCRTRWNSLIPMMERFVQLKSCIKNALEEIGREDLYNEKDFSILLNLIQMLKPAELAVKELSKTRSTLLTAEGVLTFLFTQMRQNCTSLGKKFYNYMKIRISERRNKELITWHKFLQSRNFPKTELAELSYSPKVATLSLATMLAERLFDDPDLQPTINEDMNENQVELISTASGSPSLVQQLQKSNLKCCRFQKHVERGVL